jgi:hypothetical protein
MEVVTIENLENYQRFNRSGSAKNITCLDSEVEDTLMKCLPIEFSPYEIIIQRHIVNRLVLHSIEVEKLSHLVKEEGMYTYYIWSKKLSPHIQLIDSIKMQTYLVYNGLIYIDPWFVRDKNLSEGTFGIVDKVLNLSTNDVVEYKDYRTIYELVFKGLKKIMKYTVKRKYVNGDFVSTAKNTASIGFFEEFKKGNIIADIKIE